MPRFEFGSWQGLVAPGGTSSTVVATLNRSINEILADANVKRELEEQAFDVIGGEAESFGQLIRASISSWADVIRENGLEGKS